MVFGDFSTDFQPLSLLVSPLLAKFDMTTDSQNFEKNPDEMLFWFFFVFFL